MRSATLIPLILLLLGTPAALYAQETDPSQRELLGFTVTPEDLDRFADARDQLFTHAYLLQLVRERGTPSHALVVEINSFFSTGKGDPPSAARIIEILRDQPKLYQRKRDNLVDAAAMLGPDGKYTPINLSGLAVIKDALEAVSSHADGTTKANADALLHRLLSTQTEAAGISEQLQKESLALRNVRDQYQRELKNLQDALIKTREYLRNANHEQLDEAEELLEVYLNDPGKLCDADLSLGQWLTAADSLKAAEDETKYTLIDNSFCYYQGVFEAGEEVLGRKIDKLNTQLQRLDAQANSIARETSNLVKEARRSIEELDPLLAQVRLTQQLSMPAEIATSTFQIQVPPGEPQPARPLSSSDALWASTDFLVERAQAEVQSVFVHRFGEQLKINALVEVFLPATHKLVKQSPAVVYVKPAQWRAALVSDFSDLPVYALSNPAAVRTFSDWLKMPDSAPLLKAAAGARIVLEQGRALKNGRSPLEVAADLQNYGTEIEEIGGGGLKNNILLVSFMASEVERTRAREQTGVAYLLSARAFTAASDEHKRLFAYLLNKRLQTLTGSEDVFLNATAIVRHASSLLRSLEEVQTQVETNGYAPLSFFEPAMRLTTSAFRFSLDIDPRLANDSTVMAFREQWDYIEQFYGYVKAKEYSSALGSFLQLAGTLCKKAEGCFTDPKQDALFVRAVSFAATISEARSQADVRAALHAAAEPPGGSIAKRTGTAARRHLNGYVGIGGGLEYALGTPNGDSWSRSFQPHVMVGLDFRVSRQPRQNSPLDKVTPSWSIFVPFIDLGALASYRFDSGEVATAPNVRVAQILSPGIISVWGLGRTPLALGVGVRMVPALRELARLEEGNTQARNDPLATLQGIAFISLDLPLLGF